MQQFWEPLRTHRDCSADVESESRINSKPKSQLLNPSCGLAPRNFLSRS